MFVFHHITRTGGVTFKTILGRNFGPQYLKIQKDVFDIILGYNRNHPTGGPDKLQKILSDDELKQILDQYKDIHCISSHAFPFPNRFTDFKVMVFLRNPIQRVLSTYYYLRDKYVRADRLPDYANCDFRENIQMFIEYSEHISDKYEIKNYCTNFQTHVIDNSLDFDAAISRLRHEFWFVGVTERFDESLVILRDEFKKIGYDFNIMYSKKHVHRSKTKKSKISNDFHANEKDIAKLVSMNTMDQKLYEQANKLLDKKIINYEGNFKSDLSMFKRNLLLWKTYQSVVPDGIKKIVNQIRF